jgi:hypothetical protein
MRDPLGIERTALSILFSNKVIVPLGILLLLFIVWNSTFNQKANINQVSSTPIECRKFASSGDREKFDDCMMNRNSSEKN